MNRNSGEEFILRLKAPAITLIEQSMTEAAEGFGTYLVVPKNLLEYRTFIPQWYIPNHPMACGKSVCQRRLTAVPRGTLWWRPMLSSDLCQTDDND